MEQWHACKATAQDALVFFRLGDFYEAFYEDAQSMASELGLTLTSRQNIPMCGVPVQVADQYLDKLLAKGYKIAIAEQLDNPAETKGIVRREIVRFLSPGSVIQSRLLSDQSNNFFVSIAKTSQGLALGIIDISTAEFRVLETAHLRELLSEICRLRPAEILISERFAKEEAPFLQELSQEFSFLLNEQEERSFSLPLCSSALEEHFSGSSLKKLGLDGSYAETIAAGSLLHYLKDTLYMDLSHIQTIEKDPFTAFMTIDKTCLKNLNILPTKDVQFSLVDILDDTLTPMGARMLRHWIKRPLIDPLQIQERFGAVDEWRQKPEGLQEAESSLKEIRDLERLLMRITSGSSSPKDFIALKRSLVAVQKLRSMKPFQTKLLSHCFLKLEDTSEIVQILEETFVDDPPFRLHDGPCFREGHSASLDELYAISFRSKEWIAKYQESLREELQIKTLKVGFTKAFGYYIDVSKSQAAKVPPSFHRRQTLTNSERFLSEELKEFEYKILSAEDRIKAIEKSLFLEAKKTIGAYARLILSLAKAIATIDVLRSFAKTALSHDYKRPTLTREDALEIRSGRHPIIERSLDFSAFIPNDTTFSKDARLHLITGPNMAGKSTYIRQCALLLIMAQAGSFVPAERLFFRPIDQVFSRIGASDNIAHGESTFMVEMKETAEILRYATADSLVILDEIGRGTSTYDGISIAWSVAEFLLKNVPAKTLFATHYHELTQLEKEFPGAKNFQVSVQEDAYGIVFLHKITEGKAPKSYAIHVAKLAGMPQTCLERASEILLSLEDSEKKPNPLPKTSKPSPPPPTKNLAWIEEIATMNLNAMTPIEVQQKLHHLQKTLRLL